MRGHSNKRLALISNHCVKREAVESRLRSPRDDADFTAALEELKALELERRQIDATPETFTCDGACGEEHQWGNHVLIGIAYVILRKETGEEYETIRYTRPIEAAYCLDCCEQSGLLPIAREMKAKLQNRVPISESMDTSHDDARSGHS